jgi:hypothetical protein
VSETWHRTHLPGDPVRIRISPSPLGVGWVLTFSRTFVAEIHDELEHAQRAGDDRIGAFFPHDCRLAGCTDWSIEHAPHYNQRMRDVPHG